MEAIAYANQRVLILAPHADDEALGCAGVIQKYIHHNSLVRIVIVSLTLSVSKRYNKEIESYTQYQGNNRLLELQQAMKSLQLTDFHILFPDHSKEPRYDGMLDTLPRAAIVARIEEQLEQFCPTVLYIPSITKHQDHEVTHQAAVAAARPYYWNGSIIVYETDGELHFQPNLYIPLTEQEMLIKLEALRAYQSQIVNSRHPVHTETLLHKAKFRGNQIYEEYAEAFQVIRLHG